MGISATKRGPLQVLPRAHCLGQYLPAIMYTDLTIFICKPFKPLKKV